MKSRLSGTAVAVLAFFQPASLLARPVRLQPTLRPPITDHRSLITAALAALLLFAAPHVQAAAGDADAPVVTLTSSNSDTPLIYAVAVQPDGKIILGGTFASVNGVARTNLARLNADGTLDLGWNVAASGAVTCLAVEADGKLLLGGIFSAVAGTSRDKVARLNANGTVDANFNPMPSDGGSAATLWALAVQPDGKFLIGGSFDRLQNPLVIRRGLARFNQDGTLDTSFVPPSVNPVRSIALQADGKILRGGDLSYGRLNADGTADASFAGGATGGGAVHAVAVQADGKVLLGGDFNRHVLRVSASGVLDAGFLPRPDFAVSSLALQADGKILLSGDFRGIAPNFNAPNATVPRIAVARLQAGGALDPFDPNPSNSSFVGVQAVALQADGKVLIAGNFNQLQPNGSPLSVARPSFARLLNDAAPQAVTVPSASQLLWTRGGAAAELAFATFELSTNGGASWAALPGAATRVGTTSNWQLTGLSLPTAGQIRARGRVSSAGSTGLVESVIFFSFPPEIAVSGNGVNIADGASTPSATDHTDFGAAVPGATTVVRTFTITNLGMQTLNLTGTPRAVVSGPNAAEFAVTLQPAATVAANNGTTTFQVTFTPGTAGVRNATLSLASNDTDEAAFDFAIAGRGLSYTEDSDGDGLNDAAELLGAALGFDWQVSQPALVQAYAGMANAAGLYTAAQVQTLYVDTPLIQRAPGTGVFTVTIGLRKSTALATPGSFVPLPFTAPDTVINAQGKIEFQFTVPDNAAFFRLEAP